MVALVLDGRDGLLRQAGILFDADHGAGQMAQDRDAVAGGAADIEHAVGLRQCRLAWISLASTMGLSSALTGWPGALTATSRSR